MGKLVKEKKEIIIQELITKYLGYIDVTDNTIRTYNVGLMQFMKYLKLKGIKNPEREDIINFREYLQKEHKPTTINSYLIAVRNFYSWLEYEDIAKNISKKVKGIRVGTEHKRNSLTEEQCKLVLSNTENIREKAMFLLATTCGIRANELINIRLEDFKIKDGKICLYLLGKARDYKEDFVVVDYSVYKIIDDYIKQYGINDYLFTSISNHNANGKLTTKTIRLIIKNMFKRVGIVGDEYSCHSCRHTFATLSIKNGQDIREVSQALRHKSLSTSMIYIHDLEKINNKCSSGVSNLLLGD